MFVARAPDACEVECIRVRGDAVGGVAGGVDWRNMILRKHESDRGQAGHS